MADKLEQSHRSDMREAIEEIIRDICRSESKGTEFPAGLSKKIEAAIISKLTKPYFKKFNCEEE